MNTFAARLGWVAMASDPPRRIRLPLLAVAVGALLALLAYRRRMFNRRAEEFHQRYG
jgi:hypothetical protein